MGLCVCVCCACVSTCSHLHAGEKRTPTLFYLNITESSVLSVQHVFLFFFFKSTHINTHTHKTRAPSRRSLMATCQPNRCLITDLCDIIKQSSLWKVWQEAPAQAGAPVSQTPPSPPPRDGATANQLNGWRQPWRTQIHFSYRGGG